MQIEITIPVIVILVVVNLLVLCMYGWDKHKAVSGSWRTPERTLLLGGLIAPVGAIIGMYAFHHKTNKVKFELNYVFLVIHIIIGVAGFYSGVLVFP